MKTMDNVYQLLGVPNFAPIEDVQQAFSRLYSELFVSDKPLANIPKLKEVKDAFDLLSDPVLRADYDAKLKIFLEELEESYGKAVDALSAGDYPGCITILKECLKANPREPDFYETLGLAHQLAHNLEEAAKNFQQGLSLNKKNAVFHWYLGDLYRLLLDGDNAESHYLDAAEGFKELLKVDPRNIEAQELLADTYGKMKWYEEALEVYLKLVEQFPYKSTYHRETGAVYYELDMLEDSEEHLHEALRYDSEDSSSYLYLGLVFFKKRLLQLALQYLDESLKRKKDQPEVLKLKEKILEVQADVGRTIEEIINDPEPDAVVEGTVKWYNAETGVGVVTCPEYPEVLLHHTAIPLEHRESLEKGQAIKFGIVKDKVGPIAVQIEILVSGDNSDTFPGTIEKFDAKRKIGIIKTPEGKDVLFPFSSLSAEMEGHLEPGADVLFEVKTTRGLADDAIEQAINVRPRKKKKKKE